MRVISGVSMVLALLSLSAEAANYMVVQTSTGYYVITEGPDGAPVTTKAEFTDLRDSGEPTDPVDPVDPVDPPGPGLPDGVYGLAPLTYEMAVSLVPKGSQDKAKSLSGAYLTIAQQAADGEFASVQAMVTAQKELNLELLGDKSEDWSKFWKALGTSLGELQRSGKLRPTIDAHVVAWKEISTGLRAVK